MICHEYRCIYIHQRKAAGSSIKQAFGKLRTPDGRAYNLGVLDGDTWDNRPEGYFVFSSVRNPYDRAVSGWAWLRMAYSSQWKHITLEKLLRNPPMKGKAYRHFTMPQVDTIRDGNFVTDDLIRFETLQKDFDRVCDKLGKPRVELARINKSHHRDYRKEISPLAKRLIENRFAVDLEAFGYQW